MTKGGKEEEEEEEEEEKEEEEEEEKGRKEIDENTAGEGMTKAERGREYTRTLINHYSLERCDIGTGIVGVAHYELKLYEIDAFSS